MSILAMLFKALPDPCADEREWMEEVSRRARARLEERGLLESELESQQRIRELVRNRRQAAVASR